MLKVGLVDEAWYLSLYPDVAGAVGAGHFGSAEHHYVVHGILEGRLPRKPDFDEAWYLATYADVAAAVRDGRVVSGYEHFVRHGCLEGRRPRRDD
jgi:hypothetical protein